MANPEHQEMQMDEGQMSRGAMTAWIVGAILIAGMAVVYVTTRLPPGHPYKECERLFWDDRDCKATIAARHLLRGAIYGSSYSSERPYRDPEVEAGMERARKLNREICRRTGQNCNL